MNILHKCCVGLVSFTEANRYQWNEALNYFFPTSVGSCLKRSVWMNGFDSLNTDEFLRESSGHQIENLTNSRLRATFIRLEEYLRPHRLTMRMISGLREIKMSNGILNYE